MITMKTTRHFLSAALFMLLSLPAVQAQTLTARDVFRQMPDSILPYLTENNRLDMLDFMDSHMPARVQNLFDGHSELLALDDDSLTIQMSSVQRLTLRLLTSATEIDGSRQLICLERYIGNSADNIHVICTFYSVLWRKLDKKAAGLVK